MNLTIVSTIAVGSFVLVAALQAQAQDATARYPSMAPIDQYLMAPGAEIALARSAAPAAISRDATVLVQRFSRSSGSPVIPRGCRA